MEQSRLVLSGGLPGRRRLVYLRIRPRLLVARVLEVLFDGAVFPVQGEDEIPARTDEQHDPAGVHGYVFTISTSQGAWCEITFGTLPKRNRDGPSIPRLPTTMRSASSSSATFRIVSAGSPCSIRVRGSTPISFATATPRSIAPSAGDAGPSRHANSSGACSFHCSTVTGSTGRYTHMMTSSAPDAFAITAACRTPSSDGGEPSVPVRTLL